MKRWVLHIILCILVLLPGLLFAAGGQEPPEITGSVTGTCGTPCLELASN